MQKYDCNSLTPGTTQHPGNTIPHRMPTNVSPLALEGRTTTSLPAAALLAFSGGTLDAFLYLQHGKVFAGAMTGNAVLCGIALLSHDRLDAVRHALPLLAFIVGVWCPQALQGRLRHHAVSAGLACEAGGLLLASFLPRSFPDLLFIPFIASIAAFQIASFRKVDQQSYNSTFITGDLRTLIVGLYQALQPDKREEGLRQARDLGVIVATFLLGAVAAAVLSPRLGNHTLWLAVLSLLLVLGMALGRPSQAGVPSSGT